MDRVDGQDVGTGRLVLGFDGTARSWVALRAAEEEAVLRGAAIELLAVPGGAPARPRPRRRGGRRGALPGVPEPDHGRGLTMTIDGARRLVRTRRPAIPVTATVVLSDDLDRFEPLSGAGMLVLGWMRAAGGLVDGLGAPGARLARAASVPVLVVPVRAGPPRRGPVALLRGSASTARAVEAAADEGRRRGAPVVVVDSVSDLDGAHATGGTPSLVVAAVEAGLAGLDGAGEPGERATARLFDTAPAPVLLVPPARGRRRPGPPATHPARQPRTPRPEPGRRTSGSSSATR